MFRVFFYDSELFVLISVTILPALKIKQLFRSH